MRHLNASPKGFEDYIIRSCTNNGIWMVDHVAMTSEMLLGSYDFVNRYYAGPETGGSPISIEALGGSQESDFLALQKTLNKALLN